jgi:integrase|tara:strand:- start:791 stop:2203 length:1413 start_codon:yes stop_codon:yes gene_type:complete
MPAQKSSGLKTVEFPEDSGILISEVLNVSGGNVFGGSYDVLIPAKVRGRGKGGRIRKRFKELKAAKAFAREQFLGMGERGKAFFRLDSQKQNDIAALVPVLEKSGESIDDLKGFILKLEKVGLSLSELSEELQRLEANELGLKRAVEFGVEHLVGEKEDRTFFDVSEELISLKEDRVSMGDLRPVSLEDFSYRARKMSKEFGEVTLELLSRNRVIDWIQSLGRSGRTNENYRRVCVEIFNYAMDEGYVKFSPLNELRGQKKKALTGSLTDSGSVEVLTIDEARRILKSALELRELGLLGYVILTLFCGVRAEEAKRLEWRDVHDELEKPYLTISAKIAKKRRIRNVEIPPNAVLWLTLIKDRGGRVVEFRDKNHFDTMFRTMRAHAGFSKKNDKGGWVSTWNNNAIRHSFGTYHFALYGDPIKTAVQMGHKSNDQVLFDHYRALATKEQGEAFFSIVPPKSESKLVEFVG